MIYPVNRDDNRRRQLAVARATVRRLRLAREAQRAARSRLVALRVDEAFGGWLAL